MNSGHPDHDAGCFERLRHFIVAFHDATFECIASRYPARIERGSVASVIASQAADWA